MKENKLKENIQKNIKEKIAISNLRKDIYMQKRKNRKIIYGVLASCAVFTLCLGILISKVPLKLENDVMRQAKLEELKKEKDTLKAEIYINKADDLKGDYFIDAEARKMDAKVVPENLQFTIEAVTPSDFEENFEANGIYVKGNNAKKYDVLQHYELYYGNKEKTRTITLSLGFGENKPARDYYFLNVEKISKIGDVELKITQYESSYLVIFSYKNVNYDIETNGITQEELVEFLTSLISNSKSYERITVKDEDINVKEPVENSSTNYPDYYAGRYVDNQGNNVILLKADTKENRQKICTLFGIAESKTKFETAKYSYEYLTELQDKIGTKMVNKEWTFVTSSSIMENKNWIEVQVTTNKESELKKIRELDTIGGAISIRYSKDGIAKKDMLREKD